jgi:hypothetical protein
MLSHVARPKNSAINTYTHRTAPLFYCVAFLPCRNSRRIGKAFFFTFFFSKMFLRSKAKQDLKTKAMCRYQSRGGAPVITGETLVSQCGYYGIKQGRSHIFKDTIYSISFWPLLGSPLPESFLYSQIE